MRELHIEVVPHAMQRYPTVGDWLEEKPGVWTIRVSKMSDWRYSFLVALHEQIEMALCKQRGITEEDVTQFDLVFEAKRLEGNTDEPGDDLEAPYRREHRFAENIERLVAAELGVVWNTYSDEVETL